MSEPNLHNAIRIVLIRLPNGWVALNQANDNSHEKDRQFAFESTESLQRQLVRLVGKSGWKVETPERDDKGHSKPKPSQP